MQIQEEHHCFLIITAIIKDNFMQLSVALKYVLIADLVVLYFVSLLCWVTPKF